MGSPENLLRSVAGNIAQRVRGEKPPSTALGSVVALIDNDEVELALDELVRVIGYFRIPVLRAEYERLLVAAERLDSVGSLVEAGVGRLVVGGL
ncbi:hypothetical protein [Streptomyces sp. NPDC085596]|uniref:hypothetical protein n=1 Tax=Streptomyces sp. NPDC085596 TaxID=3365731 RepID=UPI0037D02737